MKKMGDHAFSRRPKCPGHMSTGSQLEGPNIKSVHWMDLLSCPTCLGSMPENFLFSHLICWRLWMILCHTLDRKFYPLKRERACVCADQILLKNPSCLVPHVRDRDNFLHSNTSNSLLIKSCQVGIYQLHDRCKPITFLMEKVETTELSRGPNCKP